MTESYQSIITGETVTGILNCGNATLQFVNSIGLLESSLKGLVAIGIVKVITTLSTAFKAGAINASNFGTALNTVKDMSTMAKNTTQYSNALQTLKVVSKGLSDVQLKQVLSSKTLSDADRIAILRTTGLTKAQSQAKLAQLGLVQSTKAQTVAQNTATVSTFNLTAAVKGFFASLKAGIMNNPVGFAIMTFTTVFGALTSAIDSANQKAEEQRQIAKDTASEANTLGDEIAELTNKYIALSEAVKTDASAKEELISTQAELLEKLGLEGESIDDLIAKYGSLSNAIRQASLDSLKERQIDLIAGVDATREELLEIGKDGFWGDNNIITASGEDAIKAFKELEKAGILDGISYGTGGGSLILTGDDTKTEGILENYERLETALEALRDSNAFTMEELTDNSLYKAMFGRYSEMKDEVEAYKGSIADLNENLAQQTMLAELQGNTIPKTEEEFEIFRNELVRTAIASKQFIGNEKEITDAINGYLSTVPEFEGFFSIPLENELDNVDKLLGQEDFSKISTEELNENINKSLDSIQKSYDALHEFKDAMSNSMTDSALDAVAGLSDELKALVAEFYAGTVSADELFQALTNHYNNDLKNYGDAIIAKNQYSEEFYNEVGLADSEFVNHMLKNYKVDLSNCKDYNQARCEIEKQTLDTISTMWSNYYDVQSDTFTSQLDSLANSAYGAARAGVSDEDNEALKLYKQITGQVDSYRKAIEELNNITYNGIEASFDGISSTIDNNSNNEKKTNSTLETYDHIETKLESITKETEKLGKAFEKTFTVKGTEKAFKKYLAQIDKEINANKTGISVYEEKLSSIGLSEEWKNKVESGNYSIEDVTDENLKNQIKEYEKWYDKKVVCEERLIDLEEERFQAQSTYADKIIEFHEKEIASIEKLISKREKLVSLKETFGGSASAKDLQYQMGKNTDMIAEYTEQNEELTKLRKGVKKGSEAWNTYTEQINSNKEAITELTQSNAELAVEMANLPIDKYEKYLEKNEEKAQLYSAKADNTTSSIAKNKYLNKQIDLLEVNDKKAQSTAKQAAKNINTEIKDIKSAKSADKKGKTKAEKSEIDKIYKEIQSYTKSKKQISASILQKLSAKGYSNLLEQCEQYNAAILANETAQETAKLSAEETQAEIRALQKEKFDNIQTQYDRAQDDIERKTNAVNSKIQLAQTKGYLDSASWYDMLINHEKEKQTSLSAERSKLVAQLANITYGTDEWWDAQDAIQAVDEAIADSTVTLQEYINTQRQVEFDNFDYMMGQISRLISESEFLMDMMQNKDMTKDKGGLSDYGIASLGLYTQNLDTYKKQTQYYGAEIKRIQKMLADDPYNTTLIKQMQEYVDAQRDALTATEQTKKSIVDLAREGYRALFDSLSKVADKYKDVLRSAKDAHDYQNTISDKTEEADKLRKQIAAYGSMSGNEEIASKIQKANKELKDIEKDIQETMYDKYISDTENALDDMLNDLETFIEELDFDKIFNDAMNTVNSNTDTIAHILNGIVSENGTSLSVDMSSIWANGYTPEMGFKSVVSAIEKLGLVYDKQADEQIYNEASKKIQNVSGYEEDIKSKSNRIERLNSQKQSLNSSLQNDKQNLNSLITQLNDTQNRFNEATSEAEKWKKVMNESNEGSEEQTKARSNYRLYTKEANSLQNTLDALNSEINYLQNTILGKESEIAGLDRDIQMSNKHKDSMQLELDKAKARNKSAIEDFLKSVVNSATEAPENPTELDNKIHSITGGYLESYNKTQLAQLLGVKNNDAAILEKMKFLGFAKGSHGILRNQLAWTQENGGEIILRKSDGALLTPLGKGDKVFTNEMSENLWKLSQMNPVQVSLPTMPKFDAVPLRNVGGNTTIEFGDINMYGINDPKEFGKQLRNEICKDGNSLKCLSEAVASKIYGRSDLGRAYFYKF